MTTRPAPAAVASPCINLCQMDPATGWCLGCCRTIDEITGWGRLDDSGKLQVLQRLPPRRVRLPKPGSARTRTRTRTPTLPPGATT